MRLLRNPDLSKQRSGFTLTELLVVIVVIAMLTGLMIRLAAYVNRNTQVQTTKTWLCAIETALEAYKADHGSYPLTGLAHFSLSGGTLTSSGVQITNSWTLYRALSGANGGPKYMTFRPGQVQSNPPNVAYLVDIFGTAINYYCIKSPNNNPLVAVGEVSGLNQTNLTGYGGQVRKLSFDLFSSGPDTFTCAPFTNSWTTGLLAPWVYHPARFQIMANDDVWCSCNK